MPLAHPHIAVNPNSQEGRLQVAREKVQLGVVIDNETVGFASVVTPASQKALEELKQLKKEFGLGGNYEKIEKK